MISYLKGFLSERNPDSIIIEVNGMGYEVIVHSRTHVRLPPKGELILIHTHLQVLDNEFKLYGFLEQDELKLFKLLLSVSGIGTRGALGILATLEPGAFYRAIASQDEKSLTRIPGVGKKTAQRLMFELKDKIGNANLAVVEKEDGMAYDELMEALEVLGYSRSEIMVTIMELAQKKLLGTSIEENIKTVLRAKAREIKG